MEVHLAEQHGPNVPGTVARRTASAGPRIPKPSPTTVGAGANTKPPSGVQTGVFFPCSACGWKCASPQSAAVHYKLIHEDGDVRRLPTSPQHHSPRVAPVPPPGAVTPPLSSPLPPTATTAGVSILLSDPRPPHEESAGDGDAKIMAEVVPPEGSSWSQFLAWASARFHVSPVRNQVGGPADIPVFSKDAVRLVLKEEDRPFPPPPSSPPMLVAVVVPWTKDHHVCWSTIPKATPAQFLWGLSQDLALVRACKTAGFHALWWEGQPEFNAVVECLFRGGQLPSADIAGIPRPNVHGTVWPLSRCFHSPVALHARTTASDGGKVSGSERLAIDGTAAARLLLEALRPVIPDPDVLPRFELPQYKEALCLALLWFTRTWTTHEFLVVFGEAVVQAVRDAGAGALPL